MGVLSYWPLAFLVLVPLIILLYFLRQQARTQTFSSVLLWKEAFRNIQATKPWERLRKNLLLFLQILTVLLFIFALMGPWIRSLHSDRSQAILVIDNSASMGARFDGTITRLDAAKEAACSYVDDLPSGTIMHVISGNQQAVLVLSSSTDKMEAKKRIRSVEQTNLPGTLASSLGLLQSCASQSEEAEIVFYTDTAFPTGSMEASVASFYREGDNLALGEVSYSRKNGRIQILVPVLNSGASAMESDINLYGVRENGREELLDIQKAALEGKQSGAVFFELEESQTEGLTGFRAEINEEDMLAGDNSAWCAMEEFHGNRVLLLTESNLFLEKAFENLPNIELFRTADSQVIRKDSDYDLYIFDGMVPEELPDQGSFLFLNSDYEPYFLSEGTLESTVLELDESEVTAYVSGTEIGTNQSNYYQIPAWGTPYLSAGEKCCGFYGIHDGHKIAVMGFDLHQTDFGLKAEFPVLISGLSEYLLQGSLTDQQKYTAGDSLVLHGSIKGEKLQLVFPNQETKELASEEAIEAYLQVTECGIYTVRQTIGDEELQQRFAVNFPTSQESDVESAQTMISEEKAKEAAVRGGVLEVRSWILLLLLVLLLAEWLIYLRLQ